MIAGALATAGIVAAFTHSSPGSGAVTAPLRAADGAAAADLGIPSAYLALYRRAARVYGLEWTYLAAVGSAESDHGRFPAPGVLTGDGPAGAAGPAQFLPQTWERFGVDGDGDGVRSRHDPADAILSMASYLRASGAPGDWPAALLTYNRSDEYVRRVLAAEAGLRAREVALDPRLQLCATTAPC